MTEEELSKIPCAPLPIKRMSRKEYEEWEKNRYTKQYYPGDDLEFEKWAFGSPLVVIFSGSSAVKEWNKRHGYIFEISPRDSVPISLNKMYEVYLDENND